MTNGAKKMWDFHNQVPNAPILQREFWLMETTLEAWKSQGHIDDNTDLNALFGLDDPGEYSLGCCGWCEAAFYPQFEVKVLEDRGEHELVQDEAGRSVLYFKNRRVGFMPEYVDHPVHCMKDFTEKIAPRLIFSNADRLADIDASIEKAKKAREDGYAICFNSIGGYMYLRSLLGPEGALYMFYDEPDLIHTAMREWLELTDKISERFQNELGYVDEVYFAEDICYNNGPLISPDMMREFLFPYYTQLLDNIKKRQSGKRFTLHIDTDGYCIPVIDVYKEIGMTYMSPMEVASNCDVVEVRKKYPDLLILGGFDKRILAVSKEAIDREVDRIMPFMKKYGGYTPTIDHGTPAETPFENYMHYRKRMLEF